MKEERPNAIEHAEEPDDYYSELAENSTGYAQVTVDTNAHNIVPVYAEPDTQAAEDIEFNPIYGLSSDDDDSQIYEKAKSLYERAKIYEDPYQNVTGSSLYADPDMVKERVSFEIREFPRDRLRFLEKIGTGQFGEVCMNLSDYLFCITLNIFRVVIDLQALKLPLLTQNCVFDVQIFNKRAIYYHELRNQKICNGFELDC